MPSSISSSEHRERNTDRDNRPLAALGVAPLLAIVVFVVLLTAWELWVRSEWVEPSYRNSPGLWAEQRRRIDHGEGDAWVFSGSSRTLFDLQTPVWELLDGRAPIQLALEGSSPMSLLEDLAEDPDFSGKLLVGVAPGLFFSGFAFRKDAFDRYRNESPSQWIGQQASLLIEPLFAFYNFDYALPVIVDRLPWPEREGVPNGLEVRKLTDLDRNRNSRMWRRVVEDPVYQQLVKDTWADGWVPMSKKSEEARQRNADNRLKQIDRAVAAVEKMRAKGAEVIFILLPFSGHYAVSEPDRHPRNLSWDVLIERTGAIGLHFEDHPEMQGYELPEWSHMSAEEADRFTKEFYHLVMRKLNERGRQSGQGGS